MFIFFWRAAWFLFGAAGALVLGAACDSWPNARLVASDAGMAGEEVPVNALCIDVSRLEHAEVTLRADASEKACPGRARRFAAEVSQERPLQIFLIGRPRVEYCIEIDAVQGVISRLHTGKSGKWLVKGICQKN